MSIEIVLVTCPSKKNANQIISAVLKKRLAACINVIPVVQSHYWWEKKITVSSEVLLLIKTTRGKFDHLKSEIEKNHPYSVPEIIMLPVKRGNSSYLKWVQSEVQ